MMSTTMSTMFYSINELLMKTLIRYEVVENDDKLFLNYQ